MIQYGIHHVRHNTKLFRFRKSLWHILTIISYFLSTRPPPSPLLPSISVCLCVCLSVCLSLSLSLSLSDFPISYFCLDCPHLVLCLFLALSLYLSPSLSAPFFSLSLSLSLCAFLFPISLLLSLRLSFPYLSPSLCAFLFSISASLPSPFTVFCFFHFILKVRARASSSPKIRSHSSLNRLRLPLFPVHRNPSHPSQSHLYTDVPCFAHLHIRL